MKGRGTSGIHALRRAARDRGENWEPYEAAMDTCHVHACAVCGRPFVVRGPIDYDPECCDTCRGAA